ncbi:LANO_0G00122g1_1 [Lachancea nothofagi CBS 11611]|uniref:LANO_0G00122g1_1 n=1 Tax=Lachancea nothofagi CBS 11611 TaxID=1266666 RepID=A0A1G4KE30_9SACH|nr:LANO_0G00122g1_1 [Lachancea nothofagi CBS 11611]
MLECPGGGCSATCVRQAVQEGEAAPWCYDFPITKGYLQAQMESKKENVFIYNYSQDMAFRRAAGVPLYHYKLMQFGMFYNKNFRDAVWERFPELPRVGMLTHWLRLMMIEVDCKGEMVPLYVIVGEMFYRSV